MKLGKIKTVRLLITRLAVQVRLGEPKESKPLQLITVRAFSVYISYIPLLSRDDQVWGDLLR